MRFPRRRALSGEYMLRKAKLYMDTVVEIKVVTKEQSLDAERKIERAFDAFRKVEDACSRFSPDSELSLACKQIHEPVAVSPLLFEPLRFALELAEWTDGMFDPAIGRLMEEHGFNRHYLTGGTINTPSDKSATFRDIVLNERDRTLLLKKPMAIDLGAVAKGFAIDLAAAELKEFDGFLVNAGGDLFAGGADEQGNRWKIGIQHPLYKDQIIHTIDISNEAVCTSGSYERKSDKVKDMHHLIDPKTGQSPKEWISCSVVAPYAMMADSFSTASFLLGQEKGKHLLEEEGLRAVLVTPELEIELTGGG